MKSSILFDAYRELGFEKVILGPITNDLHELDEQCGVVKREVLP